jgi:hypothetical protein
VQAVVAVVTAATKTNETPVAQVPAVTVVQDSGPAIDNGQM